jgi:hypothetical protein
VVVTAVLFTLLGSAFAAEPLKEVKECISGTRWVKGVVHSIDGDEMRVCETVKEKGGAESTRAHNLVPVDVLRDGKVLRGVYGRYAYRWTDVREGDLVELVVKDDRQGGKTYCLEIAIHRRPTGRLPASQDEANDDAFLFLRVLNDLRNGEDVSDEEIRLAFPPRKERRDEKGRLLQSEWRGGLTDEWQKKLDDIRAKKKEQELKASPPKKDDKK